MQPMKLQHNWSGLRPLYIHAPLQNERRGITSKQYLLPADNVETQRKLSVAPTNLTTGDRVLESAAGSGNTVPFHPSIRNHFTVNSVVDLPNPDWTDTVSFAHQRLLVAAMNDTLWRSAVAELFRVIKPGGWVELVEIEAQDFSSWSVSPNSTRLASLINALCGRKRSYWGYFSLSPGNSQGGWGSDMWHDLWMGMMGPAIRAGGYGVADTVEEYEALLV
ncbi:hypothetical protein F5879DRAFT_923761 [Lentinula edodes]|nr:hypothetical protein F5879DRAFT_923761 [Lentinula edodes]